MLMLKIGVCPAGALLLGWCGCSGGCGGTAEGDCGLQQAEQMEEAWLGNPPDHVWCALLLGHDLILLDSMTSIQMLRLQHILNVTDQVSSRLAF